MGTQTQAIKAARHGAPSAAGVVGPIWFLVTLALLAGLHGAVDVSGHQLGRFGVLMYLGFLVYGALTMVFAIGVRAALRAGRAASTSRALLMLFACGPLLAVFTMDTASGPPSTWHGALHFAGFLLVVLVPMIALPTFATAVWSDPRWRGFGWFSIGMAALLATVVFLPSVPEDGYAIWAGPGSILNLVLLATWQVRVAHHLRRVGG
jgi:hypothetical protein